MIATLRTDPISDEIKEFLQGVDGVVEATGYEKLYLWTQYSDEWDDRSNGGYLVRVGEVGDEGIYISILIHKVRNQKILFWHATSQVVDYRIIEQWLDQNIPWPDGVRNKTDANNFSCIFRAVKK